MSQTSAARHCARWFRRHGLGMLARHRFPELRLVLLAGSAIVPALCGCAAGTVREAPFRQTAANLSEVHSSDEPTALFGSSAKAKEIERNVGVR